MWGETDMIAVNCTYPGDRTLYRNLGAVDYVKLVIIVIVMIGTFVGNMSVIVVVASNIKSSMRSTVNLYMVNLAVADLLVCFICHTSLFGNIVAADHIYLMGSFTCKARSFSQLLCMISSVLTLSAIAGDRFIGVFFPLRSRVTKNRSGLFIGFIWLVSTVVSIPLLIVRQHLSLEFFDFVQPICAEDYLVFCDLLHYTKDQPCARELQKYYYTIITVVVFFFPVCVMAVSYLLILCKVSASSIPGEVHETNLTIQQKSRMKVIKMVFMVLIVFVICWAPHQIFILYDKYGKVTPKHLTQVQSATEFLAYLNSFWNPIIYGSFNENFRKSFWILIRCGKKRARRFSTPGAIQRFRSTLTSRLTTTSLLRQISNDIPVGKKLTVTCKRNSVPNPDVIADFHEEVAETDRKGRDLNDTAL